MDELVKVCRTRTKKKLAHKMAEVLRMQICKEDKVAMISMLLYALSAPINDEGPSNETHDYISLAIALMQGIGYTFELPVEASAEEPSLILRP